MFSLRERPQTYQCNLYEIVSNMDQYVVKSLALVAILFYGIKPFVYFSRGHYAELISETILSFDHWLRCCRNIFLFNVWHLVQSCPILGECDVREISVILFQTGNSSICIFHRTIFFFFNHFAQITINHHLSEMYLLHKKAQTLYFHYAQRKPSFSLSYRRKEMA